MRKVSQELLIQILKKGVTYSRSEFEEYYSKTKYSNEIEINFRDVIFVGEIKISDELIVEDLVRFEKCQFQGDFTLLNIVFKKHLSITKCNFFGNVSFYGKQFNSISIYNTRFNNSFFFGDGKYKSVRIGNITTESVDVFGGTYDSMTIDGKNIESIIITNPLTFIGNLGFSNNLNNARIRVNNMKLNKLYISGSYGENNRIDINNLSLNTLKFGNFNNKGKINFNNIFINQKEIELSKVTIGEFFEKINLTDDDKERMQSYTSLKINPNDSLHDLHLTGDDKYYKRKIDLLYEDKLESSKSLLEFKTVQIGDMEFKNIDLEKFDTISIIDTELTSLKTFNASFPAKKVIGNHHSLYEIFNDLYSIAKNKNNKREQIEYYKAGQNALLNSLLENNWFKKIPSIISLISSKIYSNYGTRWTQSLFLITPLLSILSFSLMILTSNYDIEISKVGYSKFKEFIVYFFHFLDPTHKLNFFDQKIDDFIYSENLWFVIFDLVGRIFISIGIYETILSFRKYVRK